MNTTVQSTLVAAAVAAVTAALTLLLHPIEIGFAENDLYVLQAERLLRGEPFLDGFHPALYAQLTALVALPFGDAFVAARLVSALANGLLAAATFAAARRLGGPAAGWCAVIALATCPAVLVQALQASSDTLGAALMVATYAAALRAAATRTLRGAAVVGACLGLAMATRTSAVAIVPALLLPLAGPMAARRRLSVLGATAAGALAGYLPHALAAWSQLGSPFADHSWRNTLLKISGFDGRVLYDPPYASLFAFLREHAGEVLALGFDDLRATLGSGLGKVVATLAWPPAALAFAAMTVLALGVLAARRRPSGLVLGLVFTACLLLVCVAFVPDGRLLMPLAPLAFMALASQLTERPRWFASACALALAVAVASNLRALPGSLRAFVSAHPTAEVAAVRQLAAEGAPAPIASTYASMRRHVAASVVGIWMPDRRSLRTAADAHAHLQRLAREDGATVFVVGRRSGERLWLLLHGAVPPLGVTVVADTDDFVIVRVSK